MVDKWEREISQGLMPNLLEDLSEDAAKEILEWSQRVYKQKVERGEIMSPEELELAKNVDVETFSDNY